MEQISRSDTGFCHQLIYGLEMGMYAATWTGLVLLAAVVDHLVFP